MTYAAQRLRFLTTLLVALAALLAGCGSGMQVTPTETPDLTATPTAIPTVLYQADWSQGADGWTLPPHWSIQGGMLVNDGGGIDAIPMPYTVTTPDYEVDLVAKAAAITTPSSCAKLYGIQALDGSGNQLYYAQIYCIGTTYDRHPAASLLAVTAQDNTLAATADYYPNDGWKTYRVLVHNKGIRFFPGSSAPNCGINAPVTLSPATFALLDQHMPLVISKFAVLKLNALG